MDKKEEELQQLCERTLARSEELKEMEGELYALLYAQPAKVAWDIDPDEYAKMVARYKAVRALRPIVWSAYSSASFDLESYKANLERSKARSEFNANGLESKLFPYKLRLKQEQAIADNESREAGERRDYRWRVIATTAEIERAEMGHSGVLPHALWTRKLQDDLALLDVKLSDLEGSTNFAFIAGLKRQREEVLKQIGG
jgi:hypothetical protein